MSKKFTRDDLKNFFRGIEISESSDLITEYGVMGQAENIMNPLLKFAIDYGALGNAIQEQLNELVLAEEEMDGLMQTPGFADVVYGANPSAIKEAHRKLVPSLQLLSRDDSAKQLLGILEAAMEIIESEGM